MGKKWLLIAMSLLLLSVAPPSRAGDTDNRIKGVSEFLLERANDNWLYMVEAQIKDNDLFACYFPNTYQQMTSGNLKLLLSAGKSVWSDVVEEDLRGLASRYLIRVMAGQHFGQTVSSLRDLYVEGVLQRFSIDYAGQRYPLDRIPVGADPQLVAAINQFSDAMAEAFASLDAVKLSARAATTSDSCFTDPKIIRAANAAVKQMEFAVKQIQSNRDSLRLRSEAFDRSTGLSAIGQANLDDLLIRLLALDSVELSTLFDLTSEHAEKSHVMRILEAEAILKRLSELKLAPAGLSEASKQYTRFRRYVLSVAVLSDAESSDQVKVALQEMTLPPVSFGLKRQPEESTVMFSAYLGLSAGVERNSVDGDQDIYGLYAPLGLEYSRGLANHGSVSVMLAPLDFAYPLSLELEDQESSVEWQDVVRPSLSLTYGFEDYPIAVGFSISRARSLTASGIEDGEKETQYFLFIAFDMPLFQIF